MSKAIYKTVYSEAEYEFYEKKSKFIARIKPVESIDLAKDFIAQIKSRYSKATHNVPAFVVGTKMEHTWASDDGEPSLSAGRPMLNLLVSEGLTNVVVVTTRYFGGIKLGKGGGPDRSRRGPVFGPGNCRPRNRRSPNCRRATAFCCRPTMSTTCMPTALWAKPPVFCAESALFPQKNAMNNLKKI